jgi:hypothetical protein
MKRAGGAIKQGATEGPLEGVRWDCSWETAEAQGLFASVRGLCGADVGEPTLTREMVEEALQEARAILDRAEARGDDPHDVLGDGDGDHDHGDVDHGDGHDGDGRSDDDGADGGGGDDHGDGNPWSAPGWPAAAEQYRVERGNRPTTVELDSQELARLRRLLDDGISLERAHAQISSDHVQGRAAGSTVKALMFSLRQRGVRALDEPDARRRLAQLSDDQLLEVGGHLQRLKPEIARAWTPDEVETLIELRETLR